MKKVHRIFYAWQFEREEAWLNEMAKQGFLLEHAGCFTYEFSQGVPGAYEYRLEYLGDREDSEDYLELLREAGVEHLCTVNHWVYLRRKADGRPFELYSDLPSRMGYYRRIARLLWGLMLAEFLIAGSNLVVFCTGHDRIALVNLVCGLLCLLLGVLAGHGYRRMKKRMEALEKERAIHE